MPNLIILGDAAHIMPPSSEGVNLAMLDALELSEYLSGNEFKDIKKAIAVYERKSDPELQKKPMIQWKRESYLVSSQLYKEVDQMKSRGKPKIAKSYPLCMNKQNLSFLSTG